MKGDMELGQMYSDLTGRSDDFLTTCENCDESRISCMCFEMAEFIVEHGNQDHAIRIERINDASGS